MAEVKPQVVQPTQTPAQIEQAQIEAQLAANPMDETIPGGRYLRNGILVNANGEAIDQNGKVLKADGE